MNNHVNYEPDIPIFDGRELLPEDAIWVLRIYRDGKLVAEIEGERTEYGSWSYAIPAEFMEEDTFSFVQVERSGNKSYTEKLEAQ